MPKKEYKEYHIKYTIHAMGIPYSHTTPIEASHTSQRCPPYIPIQPEETHTTRTSIQQSYNHTVDVLLPYTPIQ